MGVWFLRFLKLFKKGKFYYKGFYGVGTGRWLQGMFILFAAFFKEWSVVYILSLCLAATASIKQSTKESPSFLNWV